MATALVAVSRLGGRARILGCLGDSRFAEQAFADLASEGVDVSAVLRTPGAEPVVAVVLVNDKTGQRTIVASFEGVTYPTSGELPTKTLDGVRCVLVDSLAGPSSVDLVRAAVARGIPVVVDLESINEFTDTLVRLASDVVVGEDFARAYTKQASIGEALDMLWDSGDHHSVVITRGAEGADVKSADGTWHQDAFRLPVVDTTGCGDVFHGAFALGRARGLPLTEVVTYATAVAGLKVRRLGGRAGIPTDAEVREFLSA